MASAESILFQINSTNYTQAAPFTIYKPQTGNSGFVTTLKLTVNLNSIPETNFPYIPDDTPPNTLEEILNEAAATAEFREIILFFKKGTGNWMERASLRIFNKEPYYDIPLIRLFSDANTIDVAEDLSLGIQIKIGNVLTSADTILVWGSAVEEKKNNGNEELAARIETLELALAGRLTDVPAGTVLGRNTGTGTVEAIPQSNFAKPSDIDTAIFNLIGGAPGALNTLDEVAQALADDANFAATITNLLALKAPLANPVFTGFPRLGGNIGIQQRYFTGTILATQGAYTVINHNITNTLTGVQCTVQNNGSSGAMTPGFNIPNNGLEYYVYLTSTQLVIYTSPTNSANIVGKTFHAIITCREPS